MAIDFARLALLLEGSAGELNCSNSYATYFTSDSSATQRIPNIWSYVVLPGWVRAHLGPSCRMRDAATSQNFVIPSAKFADALRDVLFVLHCRSALRVERSHENTSRGSEYNLQRGAAVTKRERKLILCSESGLLCGPCSR